MGAAADAILHPYLPMTRNMRTSHGKHIGDRRRLTQGKARRTVNFTSRPTLRGLLTDAARHPIAAAQVWMATRIDGSDWQLIGPPHTTGKDGRLGFRLPGETPSRQVNLVYFPFSDSHEQA